MLNWLNKLRDRFVSPMVAALCVSLKHDPDIWIKHKKEGVSCAIHTSKRFGVVDLGAGGTVAICDLYGREIYAINKLEDWLLRRAISRT